MGFTRHCPEMFFLFDRFRKYAFGHEVDRPDATDTKAPDNSTSPRPESNGRHPGPGLGQQSGKQKLKLEFAYPSYPGYRVYPKLLSQQHKYSNHCGDFVSLSLWWCGELIGIGASKRPRAQARSQTNVCPMGLAVYVVFSVFYLVALSKINQKTNVAVQQLPVE